jgi:hypothetical protein
MKQEAAKAVLRECSSPLTPTVVRIYAVYLLCITFLQNKMNVNDESDEVLNRKELLLGIGDSVIQALYGTLEDTERYLQEDLNTLVVRKDGVIE